MKAPTADDKKSCKTLMTLDYGNCGIFLIMGNAGFVSSTAAPDSDDSVPSSMVISGAEEKLREPIYS